MTERTLDAPVAQTLVIRKSRFIAGIETVTTVAEMQARIEHLRRQHPDASHICYAALIDGQVAMSDDGEPSGTAARPMLNVLQHKNLNNVLATVVRYFGGVKLGAGGLVRAYSQAVSEPLNDAAFSDVKPMRSLVLSVPFEFESLARRLATAHDLELTAEYTNTVHLALQGESNAVSAYLDAVSEPTRGAVQVLAGSDSLE